MGILILYLDYTYTTFLYKHLPEMKTITTHVLTESKVYVNVFLKFELYAFLAYCTVSEEINAFINRLNHNWYNTKKNLLCLSNRLLLCPFQS